MKIQYKFKDKLFDDIRDIVYNNTLSPNFYGILNEYLPYQVFLSWNTFFEGVRIQPNVEFKKTSRGATAEHVDLNLDILESSFKEYFSRYPCPDNVIAAVSGGIDSSAVAIACKPDVIYTGYYNVIGYDETEYAALVAKQIGAQHKKLEITERDYIEHIDEYLSAICTPVGGLGGISELIAMKYAVRDFEPKAILFGNGGDEIFMGYFFNQLIKDLHEFSRTAPVYMHNFLPSQIKLMDGLIDLLIISAINKAGDKLIPSDFIIQLVMNDLAEMDDIVEKLLWVNINITLPSLLHLSQQTALHSGVIGLNPLANRMLIGKARGFNTITQHIPKGLLRKIVDLPKEIKARTDKMGFPVPVEHWHQLDDLMHESYDNFFRRKITGMEKLPYDGINRRTWGIFMIDRWLNLFVDQRMI